MTLVHEANSSCGSSTISAPNPDGATPGSGVPALEPAAAPAVEATPDTVPAGRQVVTLPRPLHALPGFSATTVRRGVGRPRRIRPAPLATEADYDAAVRTALERHVDGDALVAATEMRSNAAALLDAVILAVARETAGLSHDITFTIRDKRSLERAIGRRIEGLRTVAKLVLERRKLEADSPEVPAAVRERVTSALVRELERVAVETLGAETANVLMSTFRRRATTAER